MAEKTSDAAAKTNGYDREQVEGYVQRHDNLDAALAELKAAHDEEAKSIKEDQAELIDEAKKVAKIPKKAFKHIVAIRRAKKKLAEMESAVDVEISHDVDLLWMALEQLEMPV